MNKEIYYGPISEIIYSSNRPHQGFIPFLGAGVPISVRSGSERKKDLQDNQKVEDLINKSDLIGTGVPISPHSGSEGENDLQDSQKVEDLINKSNLNGLAQLFAKCSLYIAYMIQNVQDEDLTHLKRLKDDLSNKPVLPSPDEIAHMLSTELKHETLSCYVTDIMNVFNKYNLNIEINEILKLLVILRTHLQSKLLCEPLSIMSQYFEYKIQRNQLWTTLKDVFKKPRNTTEVHKYFARVAKYHIENHILNYHYLILTTNYDDLMENALDEEEVPYIVVTIKSNPQALKKQRSIKLHCQFSKHVKNRDKLIETMSEVKANEFCLDNEQKFAILYKIHGSLDKDYGSGVDNIIISDNDYISYIGKTLDNCIPGKFSEIFKNSPILFLGYSLRDWNIRSFFLKLQDDRPDIVKRSIKDHAILKPITQFDLCIFEQYNILTYEEDLNEFIKGLIPYEK